MQKDTLHLIEALLKRDVRALARLITYVENHHDDLLSILSHLSTTQNQPHKIGITGPPGAGKSTLVDKLIRQFRAKGQTVGVVAIDPSSPFTGGAVLGDRIRMQDHSADEGVFIRSVGSRGAHGGLSRATADIVMLMTAFGFDIVLIETVGVGQTELDIMNVASSTVVVLVPESGDTIQTMKAGLMEIADIFVVNKADREGADKIANELQILSHMYSQPEWPVPVLQTTALKNEGVGEIIQKLMAHTDVLKHASRPQQEHDFYFQRQCLDIVLNELSHQLQDHLPKHNTGDVYSQAQRLLKKIHIS